MSTATRKRTGVAPCASCQHRWGRHDGGIGRCSEPGCECGSFNTGAKERERAAAARRQAEDAKWRASPEGQRWTNMTAQERDAEVKRALEESARLVAALKQRLDDFWRQRFERPTPRSDEGIDPAAALRELGLDTDATAPDVARAFRRRAMETHPDHAGGDAEAFKHLIRVRDAALSALEGA